eukprot:CAMPEP_0195060106 /NCGR_PEP_ID=MMETSP0448-20130528/7450_1 /TAXON_ID=66468 /ORGANISM="Heterocapsa triquestra, Strain CCMP 448" /LENGTH=43 /DNA_ID= /DNA_START= /DNA_END= /DNA_ORIENTATION=
MAVIAWLNSVRLMTPSWFASRALKAACCTVAFTATEGAALAEA